jgi:hypothetical protein
MAPSRALHVAARILPFLLALYVVLLQASYRRPLWIDEVTHFVFGAEPSTTEAWALFLSIASTIQHGHTGTYIMLDYWLLNFIGIDPLYLRLPSILSGLFVFLASIILFRTLGFSVLWQIILVLALCGQHMLLYFLAEARAYIPIAAASVGLLLFYVAYPKYPTRRAWLLLGVVSALLGASMHPYFAVYWPAVCLVAYVHRLATTEEPASLRGLILFSRPWLVALGAGLYLLLAALTWLRGHPTFNFDPFQWLRPGGTFSYFTDFSHTQFLHGRYLRALVFTAIVVLGAILIPARLRGRMGRLWAPILLMVLSIAISLLLGWISYRVNYWILPRQWVASVALFAIGTVWLWAEAAKACSRLSPLLGLTAAAIAASLVFGQAAEIHRTRLAEWRAQRAEPSQAPSAADCVPVTRLDTSGMTNDQRNEVFVELANRNVACGGHVWPVFRRYYRGGEQG